MQRYSQRRIVDMEMAANLSERFCNLLCRVRIWRDANTFTGKYLTDSKLQ
jgi:hypothetical protein